MTWYNLVGAKNVTTMLGVVQNANTSLLDGWFGTLILLGLVPVFFSASMYRTNDTAKSALYTSVVIAILAVMMASVSLIGEITLFIAIIGCACAIAMAWKSL